MTFFNNKGAEKVMKTKYFSILISLVTVFVAGCASITKPPPEGCRPVYSDADIASKINNESLKTDISQSTYILGTDGVYTSLVADILALDNYRYMLNAEIKARSKDKSWKGIKDIEEISKVDLNDIANTVDLVKASSATSKALSLTPISVTTTLISIEQMLDDLMNRMNSTISSALFAMRGHVAATTADINVMFRDRMQEAYDNLNEAERTALDRAQLMATQAMASLEKLEEEGFSSASDLICQTTANFANYPNTLVGLGLPFERCFAPDVLCLSDSHDIRDTGSENAEQLLQFRGVNLLPNGEYPDARILVGGEDYEVPSAGGKSVLQVPLRGAINGKPNDISRRGSMFTRVEFDWPKNSVQRRWFFELKPFLVRNVEVTMTPTIEGPVRTRKDQECGVKAEGGSVGSREETATCTIISDADKSIELCQEVHTISHNGNAKIRNRLFTPGACQWEVWAKSEAWFGAGAWIHFLARANQVKNRRIPGRTFGTDIILNQGQASAVFEYPTEFVPPEYRIITGRYSYNVRLTDNEGRSVIFTESNPSNQLGSAIMQGNRLTVTLNSP
ncbi:MAG: hypothetical protein JAY62_00665 [Candidatus Thiodiazotropha endolucinida]|nr:hypothetical protein [Candidatus Thiodiazotropha taylori]MCW4273608.1 hypothetical protein [Candidatus Thiodiazotropha taylori]